MKSFSFFLVIPGILVAAAVVILPASIYTIDEAEQAIIVQLGAPVGEPIKEPGLHFKVPFVQDVIRFDKRLISWNGDPNQIPTRGEQFISVDTTARWRIVDPLVFLQRVQNERGATTRLNDILDSVVRDVVSGTELEEIVRSADW
ncbi:MAG: SPFH domain-containing protein, partial [Opitutaceae bacterium]